MYRSSLIMTSRDGNFSLRSYESIGVKDTPYTALECISHDLAYKHVVEIRLNSIFQNYDGTPIHHKYRDCYVSHGIRSSKDTLEDTEDYIAVLEEAVDFARKINCYLRTNKEWRADTEEE